MNNKNYVEETNYIRGRKTVFLFIFFIYKKQINYSDKNAMPSGME